jgi:hypothetical protein
MLCWTHVLRHADECTTIFDEPFLSFVLCISPFLRWKFVINYRVLRKYLN